MHPPSSTLNAAIRAMRGESNLDAVRPALEKEDLARVIACASGTDRIVRALAALRGGLPALLDPPTIADPALHDAVARMIGTPEGESVLRQWAQIVPAGWGAEHAVALVNAVTNETCSAGVAAALIGPCDQSAALLHDACEITFAIRRWGQSSLDKPTAWMHALSVKERDRLIDVVQREPYDVAISLPWLPSGMANQTNIHDYHLYKALYAFAEASPTARAQHASIVQRLVEQAQSMHLESLTRLACAMQSKTVWQRVQTLIHEDPDAAYRVVAAAPWNALAKTVRTAIMEHANQSDICAAIAAARGRKYTERITTYPAAAFFAALDPQVWDALPFDVQRQWIHAMWKGHACLAVRALGPRPEVLAKAELDNNLVTSARRHTSNVAEMRWALLPVALRNLRPDAASQLIAALPTPPPDPGAFFCIFRGKSDPAVTVSARAALRTGHDLVLSFVMQHCAHNKTTISEVCTTLHHALMGRSGEDLKPIISLLGDDVRNALMPDADALVERLAHPDRRDALRQTLARLTSLPLEVAIPTQYALRRWGLNPIDADDAATVIAFALRGHGDVFLTMVDALDDEHSATLLPLLDHAAQADALRALASDDPSSAHRLARTLANPSWRAAITVLLTTPPSAHNLVHAVAHQSWRAAMTALLTMPPHHADAIWHALTETERYAITLAAPAVASPIEMFAGHDPVVALALAAVQSDDADVCAAGVDALAARSTLVRTIWDQLPLQTQQSLRQHPSIALAIADLPQPHDTSACQRFRHC